MATGIMVAAIVFAILLLVMLKKIKHKLLGADDVLVQN
jgi:hypothetical protein